MDTSTTGPKHCSPPTLGVARDPLSVSPRETELDGAVYAAKQALPATANWSTWTTLTLTPVTLTAGTHTLKVWFDGTAGSSQYVNLDNLTVTSPAG